MRTVINLLSTLKPKTGIGHYAARLFDALQRTQPDLGISAFPTGAVAGMVRRAHRAAPSGGSAAGGSAALAGAKTRLKGLMRSAGNRCLGLAFRAACRRHSFDLYHEPNFIPFASDVPTVVTVADLSVVLHPEWHPADRVHYHEKCFRRGLAHGGHVLTISEFIRREAIDELDLPPSSVTAVHLGVGEEYFDVPAEVVEDARAELRLPAEYLLCVGTIEPRKNILRLLQAYCALPAELRARCPLVLAGGWGWKSEDVAEFFHAEAVHNNVIHLGYLPDHHLPGLYAGARALVFPSHYEGFGLPPLEMLATGGPVIASTAAAHREVLGPCAHYVDRWDDDGWVEALRKAITEPDWLMSTCHGGRERARRFTWEACAAGTADVYRRVAGREVQRRAA